MPSIRTSFRLRPSWCQGSLLLLVASLATQAAMALQGMGLEMQLATSDVIVIGSVVSVRQMGATHVRVGSRDVAANLYEAEVRVDQTLKGATPPSVIIVKFVVESNPAGRSGHYMGVGAESYRMLFLKQAEGHFKFVEPRRPTLPAVPSLAPSTSDDPFSGVLDHLGTVLASPKAADIEKLEVVWRLETVSLPKVTEVLGQQITAPNLLVRAAAVAALVQRNHIAALAAARDLLMKPAPGIPDYLLGNIASAIGRGIRDEKAIPLLADLVRAPGVRSRRSAADALSRMSSEEAVPALAVALRDTDQEVRYYAVIGLADITHQPEWRPLREDFVANEGKYLTYWRSWAATHLPSTKPN